MSPIAEASNTKQHIHRLILAIALAFSAAIFLAYVHFALENPPRVNDFLVFWSAARYMQQAPLYGVYDPALFDAFRHGLGNGNYSNLPFLYPPFTAFLFSPFGLLSFHWAFLAWNICSLMLYAAAVWHSIRPRTIMAMGAIVSPATVITLVAGQVGLLTSALTLFGITQLGKRPILAGGLLGLLAIKPQLALLPCLVLLTARQYRACLAALLTIAALALSSLAAFGVEAWSGWIASLSGFAANLNESAPHQQFGITTYFTLLDLGFERHFALVAQLLVSVAVVISVTRALGRGQDATRMTLLLIGLYLATPYALVYDMPAISAACLMLLGEFRSSRFRTAELLVIAAAWFAPLLLVLPHMHASAIGLAALLALFLVALLRIRACNIVRDN